MAGTDIKFVQDTNKIDILIGGNLITTYRYGSELTKPILYPVKSPSGIVLTRRFPFEIIPGESNDHPHHMGIFFAYDKVNNDGFWNNTTSPPQIKHIKTTKMENGQLSTISHWVGKSGKTLLEEKRDMVFSAEANQYTIDFNITLTAQDEKIVFGDTKEGMFAIRVADWLSEEKGTGKYLDSKGNIGEPNVWGKKADWARLEGTKEWQNNRHRDFQSSGKRLLPNLLARKGLWLIYRRPIRSTGFPEGPKRRKSSTPEFHSATRPKAHFQIPNDYLRRPKIRRKS